ncbi:MAG: hypothetical protein JKY65_03580 [Planctomycetes bacterium]|nr:hypothetical protein [Planctomycetota bacterium]
MRTNDVKKGAKVRLTDGRVMEVCDNRRRNVRGIRGPCPIFPAPAVQRGDSYVWEWAAVLLPDGSWESIELTDSQCAARRCADALRGR